MRGGFFFWFRHAVSDGRLWPARSEIDPRQKRPDDPGFVHVVGDVHLLNEEQIRLSLDDLAAVFVAPKVAKDDRPTS